MKSIVAGLIFAVVLLAFGPAAVEVAGETWPGGNGDTSPILRLAGETWPGGN